MEGVNFGQLTLRVRKENKKRANNTIFPVFFCPHCRVRVQLDFDPLKCPFKWHKFHCPDCNWHNPDDDYAMIRKIRIELKVSKRTNMVQ